MTLRTSPPASRTGRLLAASVLLAAAACAPEPVPASVLLITIDTLRADHLGLYGYPRPTSPRIDALAREGVVFRQAFTPVPRTTQAVASILTGVYPKRHRARGLFSYLAAGNETMAEILRSRGYRTEAVVSNLFLRPGKGFEQGFDSYSNPRSRFDGDSARMITDEALQRIRAVPADRPFFLWVHYLDPHWTYDPAPEYQEKFDPGYRPSLSFRALAADEISKGDLIFGRPLPPADHHHLEALYDGEIAQTDEQVGRLLDGIPEPIRKNLLVVFTSDHGESLGEHDYSFAHGEYLYDGTLRVPLFFVFPGRLSSGEVTERTVSLIDVAPTVLRLLGLPDRVGMDGVPLFKRAGAGFVASGGRRLLFAESDYQLIHAANPRFHIPGVRGRWSSVRQGSHKLIRIPRGEGSLLELYDLAADPDEERNLAATSGAPLESLIRELAEWIDDQPGTGPDLEESLSPDEKARIRSLGYLQ